jgi:hypothetical protein
MDKELMFSWTQNLPQAVFFKGFSSQGLWKVLLLSPDWFLPGGIKWEGCLCYGRWAAIVSLSRIVHSKECVTCHVHIIISAMKLHKLFEGFWFVVMHICMGCLVTKPFKPQPVQKLFKTSVRTAKKTQHFTVTTVKWLTLLKEIIAVCTKNHTKCINTKFRVIRC